MARGRPAVCPHCQSTDTRNKGYRMTKGLGKRRIKVCKACKRRFTPKNQKPVDDKPAMKETATAVSTEEPLQLEHKPTDSVESTDEEPVL